MAILDEDITKKILQVTCSILERNFFYDGDSIKQFLDYFTDDMVEELDYFVQFAEPQILQELETSYKSRLYFTCYFVSAQLRYIFLNKLHFTEEELHAFENFLPRYTGENNEKHRPSKHARTHDRKFFK